MMGQSLYDNPASSAPITFTSAGEEAERQMWGRLFAGYIPLTGYVIPIGKRVRVLDLGCSTAAEALPVTHYFMKNEASGVAFFGIDADKKAISKAREKYGGSRESGIEYEFIYDDATKLDSLVSGHFDIVASAHPEVSHRYSRENIFRLASSFQYSGDLLVSTVYLKDEMDKVVQALDPFYDIRVSERNVYKELRFLNKRNKFVVMALRK